MVHYVVTNVPQAVGGERWQESNTAQPFIEVAVWRQTLVASVVTQDEQAADHKTSGHTR